MNTCSDCEKPALARGMCGKHYRQWLASPKGTARIVPGPYRPPHRVKFTPELWSKWLARQAPTEHTFHLREGIQRFRSLLK